MKTKKGFTLIELLIVIAIIGVLAVAFLPTLLGAPAKGRDTSRIAALQTVQKVIVNSNLQGKTYPGTTGQITAALVAGAAADTWSARYLADFGGAFPVDPSTPALAPNGITGCAANYCYLETPGNYSFGLAARVELLENANTTCTAAGNGLITEPTSATAANELCYAIFTQ